jgi:chromate transporter
LLYLALFWSFFQIGLFSFGGGMAAIPLIQNQIVTVHGWLTLEEFTNLITISEMTPGPIAINSATFVGTRIAGIGGALVATVGCILPACFIVTMLAWLYGKYKELPVIKGALAGLRPTVVALIFSAGLSILTLTLWGAEGISNGIKPPDMIALLLMAGGLVALRKFKANTIFVMLGCGVVGGVLYLAV